MLILNIRKTSAFLDDRDRIIGEMLMGVREDKTRNESAMSGMLFSQDQENSWGSLSTIVFLNKAYAQSQEIIVILQ